MKTARIHNTNYKNISSKEWLITNGLGGYSSSTICGVNTRRYHGLLVVAENPPTDRKVLISKVEETVISKSSIMPMATSQYPGTVSPDGYRYLTGFNRFPLPCMRFQNGDCIIEKTICMVYNSNTTVIKYQNKSSIPVTINCMPLFVDRDFHGLFHSNDYNDYYYEDNPNVTTVYSHLNATPLFVTHCGGTWNYQKQWYYNLEYLEELDKGFDFREDAVSLGHITFHLAPGEDTYLLFTTDRNICEEDPADLIKNELERQQKLIPVNIKNPFFRDLIVSGDQFVVKRESTNQYSLIAGYHWFADWGRDTMIAIRGLCIALDRKEISKSIIRTFIQFLDKGMLPNRFPDYPNDKPEYNSVDAALWFFVAIYEYDQQFNDACFLKEVQPALKEILLTYIKGTRYNIHITKEGFVYAGDMKTQLTWMDARIGDYAVTPRNGCPVEINALWYNALKIYQSISARNGDEDHTFDLYIKKIKNNFKRFFGMGKGT